MGTPDHVALNASLLPVAGGSPRAEAKVEGVADSLPQLVDRLIAQLITEEAGAPRGLAGLVNRPLPALRLYLEAQAAYRRANYADAVARLSQALDLDSTFALAGLRLASAAGWTTAPGAGRRGLERAWGSRDRLSPPDLALLMAEVGPDYPAVSPLAKHLAWWERAVDLAPDQPERWYELGDEYFHEGPYLQIESTRRRAAEAFRRSVALDSGTAPLGHLLEIAVLEDDSATVRRLAPLYLARDSSGELLGFYRWRIAEGLHDEPALTALRAQYRQMRLPSLWRIMNYAVLDGRRLEDAESAAVAIRATAGRSSDWQRSKTYLHAFEINRGHPAKALGDTARSDEDEYAPHTALYERVLDAMYGDGDSVNGSQAARELARLTERPASGGSDARAVAQTDLCVATLWRLSHGELGGAAQAIDASPVPRARRLAGVAHHQHRVRRAARGEARGRLRRRRRGGRAGSPGHPHAERARRISATARPCRSPSARRTSGPRSGSAPSASKTSPTWRWPACASAKATFGPRSPRSGGDHTPTTSPITWPRTCARRAAWPPSPETARARSGPTGTTWRCGRTRSRRCGRRSTRYERSWRSWSEAPERDHGGRGRPPHAQVKITGTPRSTRACSRRGAATNSLPQAYGCYATSAPTRDRRRNERPGCHGRLRRPPGFERAAPSARRLVGHGPWPRP